MTGRVKIYHAIWDCDLCAYAYNSYNTTDEEITRLALLDFVAPGQDQLVLDELDDLTVDELAKIVGCRIERSFIKFPGDADLLSYE